MVEQNIILNGTATAVIRKRKQGLSIRTLERRNNLRSQWLFGKPIFNEIFSPN